MIDLRAAVAWLPGFGGSTADPRARLARRRAAPALAGSQAALRAYARAKRPAGEAPWSWLDLGEALLWLALMSAGGVLVFLVARVLCSFAFAVGEATGRIHPGTYDSLLHTLAPYSTAGTWLLVGSLFGCSAIYALYRVSIRRYSVPWSALYVRPVRRRTLGLVALFAVPLLLAGALLLRVQEAVLGAVPQNPEVQIITRGVPVAIGNVLLLVLLLVVVLPVVEELVFRAFLYRLLRQTLPTWAAALGCSVAAAAAHGVPALLAWLLCMGVGYAFVLERTKSVLCAILLHGMVNSLAALSVVAVMYHW
jgi:membrane protease YdiL (CAAX protease family)